MTSPGNSKYPRMSPPSQLKGSGMRNERPGAPPTESLYTATSAFPVNDGGEQHLSSILDNKFASPALHQQRVLAEKENFQIFSPRNQSMVQSPPQIDPFYSQGI